MKKIVPGVIVVLVLLLVSIPLEAQEMIIRYYILPIEEIGNARGPKYLKWRFGTGTLDVQWSCKDFGLTNQMLCAVNAEQVDHDVLLAQTDIVKIPANLDNNVTTGALSATREALEDLGIPGNWINTSHTYRDVVRFVAGLFFFAQRHHALHGQEIKPSGLNLNNTWSDLSSAWRQNLRTTADTFEYNYSNVTGSTTMRIILKSLGDQWGNTPIEFGFTTL